MAVNYRKQWTNLISDLCKELVKIENIPQEKRTIEDEWVKTTIIAVLKKMCALHKVHPRHQRESVQLTKKLFED